MMNVATALDAIGWVNFMEGKLPKALFSMQASALACSPSRLSIVDWSKQLVSRILHISHAQWIFRNFTLHDKAQGYLTQVKRQAILKEIDKLSQLDPNDIPPGSRYLLEMDFSTVRNSSLDEQSYWVLAMKAARKAGRRAAARRRRTPASVRRQAARIAANNRRPYVVTGATETLHSIEIDMGMRAPPSRRRPSSAISAMPHSPRSGRPPDD
jgi:hypothetical protein